MKWTVTWNSQAEDELLEKWMESPAELRGKITAAINELDQVLQRSPQDLGESRGADA